MLFMSCVCHAFASVRCCLVITCWERTDLLALVCMFNCVFVTSPCGILSQVWYLIVSIPDLCHLSYSCSLNFFFYLLVLCLKFPDKALHVNVLPFLFYEYVFFFKFVTIRGHPVIKSVYNSINVAVFRCC